MTVVSYFNELAINTRNIASTVYSSSMCTSNSKLLKKVNFFYLNYFGSNFFRKPLSRVKKVFPCTA